MKIFFRKNFNKSHKNKFFGFRIFQQYVIFVLQFEKYLLFTEFSIA